MIKMAGTGAKRGRKSKPTELKVLEGNPGNRPINIDEPKPEPQIPERPKWLKGEAKKEWDRIAPKLDKLGLLTNVDTAALAGYCQAYARWVEAETFINKHGMVFQTPSGYIQQVPHVAIAQKYLVIMSGFLGKFGLSPADRVGLKTPKGQEKRSKLASLLSG